MSTKVAPDAGPLRVSESADTVVIGSGIAGLSTAYEFTLRGQDVVVLDRGPIAMGMTSRTTAHLVAISDDSFDDFIKLRGLEAAKLYYQSQSAAVDRIESIQRDEAISCNFRRVDGFLFPAIGGDPSELDPEMEAGRKIGVAMEEAAGVPFRGREKVRCLRYLNQATFHPLEYLRGLAAAITARNGRLYADTVVEAGTTDYLIVGGADHKTGEADDGWVRFEGLESWIRGLVPDLGNETHRWSGQVMEPIDYSGFIGRSPGLRNVYVATGDSGQGITHGAVAGLLIADLIANGGSRWEELYDPSRKTVSAIKNFLTEVVPTAAKSFSEYLAPGELASVDDLKPGHGGIVREGLSKIAAYRDENGVLYRRSAMCTHVGCHVHWNSLERCWDCPCHGSHFAVDGTVLNAPAVSPLASAADEKADANSTRRTESV